MKLKHINMFTHIKILYFVKTNITDYYKYNEQYIGVTEKYVN